MGFDGNGNFTRTDGTRTGTDVWQQAKSAGVKILDEDHDTHDEDIADGLENTVCLDGQNTTTTDNAILRYDSGNSKFEGVAISASQFVGRGSSGDLKGINVASARALLGVGSAAPSNSQFLYWASASSQYVQATAATARSLIGIGTAAPANEQALFYASASGQYVQKTAAEALDLLHFPNVNADVTATDEELNDVPNHTGIASQGVVDATNGGADDLTEIDFTSIPSSAKRITVVTHDVSGSGSSTEFEIEIGDSGGFEVTGYDSQRVQLDGTNQFINTSTSSFVVAPIGLGNLLNATIILILFDESNNRWILNGTGGVANDNSLIITSGSKDLSGTLDRIRVTTNSSDTFDNGNVDVIVE